MGNRPTARKILTGAGLFLLYGLIAVGMTWPLARHLSTRLPGGSHDTLVHYWNGWWARQALGSGQSPYQTDYLYYPQGMSLVYHNFAWLSIVTWIALQPLVGGFAAYNLSILINLALCGLAAYLLALELTGNRRAAFLAGVIYLAWPFRLYQLDHPNLISTMWIPLFLLFLIRTMKRKRWTDGLLTGVFLVLTAYTRWQQLIPAVVLGAICFLGYLPRQVTFWRRWLPPLLLGALVTLVALAPPFVMLVEQQRTAPADVLPEGEEQRLQTDVLSYITPSRLHPVLKPLTGPAYDRYYNDRHEARHFPAYVGFLPLILALWGMGKARRATLPWAAMALVLILLALGPNLRINGQTYEHVPMPYDLASRLYFVRLLRVPDRFNMFLASPVAMLAAFGAADLLSQPRRRWLKPTLLGLFTAVILFEFLSVPQPLREPHRSDFYHQMAAEPDEFAVLNLPIDPVTAKRYMFAQITHRRPIVQGKTPRFPEGTFDYIGSNPWLRSLRQRSTMPPLQDDVSRQLGTLAQDGVRYVILHKDVSNPQLRLSHWRHYFLIAPRFEDETIVVYPTAPRAGEDFALTCELAPGIGPIRVVSTTGCLNPGQPLGVSVAWGTTAPPGEDLDVRLALLGAGGELAQEYPLLPGWPAGEWPADTLVRAFYDLYVPPEVPNGTYTATLALVEPGTGAPARPSLVLGPVTVDEGRCPLPLPTDATRTNALFGSQLRLLGYQLRQNEEQLTLTLHWRAERLMEIDYKVFVHVFEPETGFRPMQDDSMPLRWTYPTSYWSVGEVVVDEIPLSLQDVPPGAYAIAIGVYDPADGGRLPVLDRAGEPQPDGQMVLPDEWVMVEDG